MCTENTIIANNPAQWEPVIKTTPATLSLFNTIVPKLTITNKPGFLSNILADLLWIYFFIVLELFVFLFLVLLWIFHLCFVCIWCGEAITRPNFMSRSSWSYSVCKCYCKYISSLGMDITKLFHVQMLLHLKHFDLNLPPFHFIKIERLGS